MKLTDLQRFWGVEKRSLWYVTACERNLSNTSLIPVLMPYFVLSYKIRCNPVKIANIPFQFKFVINEKSSSKQVLEVLIELQQKYRQLYHQLVNHHPYPVDVKQWKADDASALTRTELPFLFAQVLNIELTLWQQIQNLKGTPTKHQTDNAIRFLNLLKKHPSICPEPKDYMKWQ